MKKVKTRSTKTAITLANRAFGQVRTCAGMDLATFATELGVSLGTSKAVSSGVRRCSRELAAKLEYCFGLDRRAILTGNDARDLIGRPYTADSYKAWKALNIWNKAEFEEMKDRTLRRIELLLEAAHSAEREVPVLAVLEDAISNAVADFNLQDELLKAYGELPKAARIPIVNSTFDEVTRVLRNRINSKR